MTCAIIQGISPVLPILIILLVMVTSVVLAWWSYNHLTTIETWKKWNLIALRSGSLVILSLLLLNPYLINEIVQTNFPVIAVYLDNSESLSVQRGEYNGFESYQTIVDDFKNGKSDFVQYEYFLFDEDVYDGDEIDLSGTSTNLHNVIEHIVENESRYKSSIIFSDGIITRGRNPVFIAQNVSNPIITVPVGDTTRVKDIAISNVEFSQPVYTNTVTNFRVNIQQEGFDGEESTLQFLENGELVETGTIDYPSASSSHIVEFSREYMEPGFYEVEFHIPPKDDEFTERNNTQRLTVEVLDDKTRILSLAFEIHPDVRSIRRLIATDQQNELISSTALGNQRYAGIDPREIEDDLDLIIIHGHPDSNSPLIEWVLERNEPILFLATPITFNSAILSQFDDIKPIVIQQSQNFLNSHIRSTANEISHPLLEFTHPEYNRFPTLQTMGGSYNVRGTGQVLLETEFQRTATDIPLLVVDEAGGRRVSLVNAFGWYRYEQSRQENVSEFFKQLFTNIISWTSTPPDRRNLIVEPIKDSFSESESVELRATLVNERGEPEPNALIELQINTNGEDRRVFRMNHIRDGVYSATIGSYPEGLYQIEANAVLNNRVLGEAETRVNVSRSNLELIDTRRNDSMLRQISSMTNGLLIENQNPDELNMFLSQQDISEPIDEIVNEISFIYQTAFWFFVVITLLSIEWLMRRSVSLP